MIIKEGEGDLEEEEYVNVEDIEYIKTNEIYSDVLDVCYLV
jgi:hypothetical protein